MRLLLVEDDNLLGDGIRAGLQQNGFTVDWVTDGRAARRALQTDEFDLVVLDWGLPVEDGIELLAHLRRGGNGVPVLMLTARDTVSDRVRGLDSGADDYLVKPFDLEELCARLRALLRRRGGRASPVILHGAIQLDPAARRVSIHGQPVDVSPREFAVLELLMENTGKVMSRERLEEALYGWSGDVESNTLEVYIHHLRRKLGNDLIHTIRGVGYLVERCA